MKAWRKGERRKMKITRRRRAGRGEKKGEGCLAKRGGREGKMRERK